MATLQRITNWPYPYPYPIRDPYRIPYPYSIRMRIRLFRDPYRIRTTVPVSVFAVSVWPYSGFVSVSVYVFRTYPASHIRFP